MQTGHLSGTLVVDMTEGVAGPYAAMVLADMGAEVVKVERPAGDWARPADHATVAGEGNAQFVTLNRNKRDIGLDVTTPGGRAVLTRLVERADVLLSNYRAGVMTKLGFGYEACRARNGQLIYCTISGFGQDSAYAHLPASDTIIQAMSGVMSLVGEPDGPPLRVGFPLIDMAAAGYAVQGILHALIGRLKGGGGANLDVSLMAAAVAFMGAGYTRFLASGKTPLRQGNANPTLAPAGAFRCGDGRYVSLAILRDEHWRKLCDAMQLGDLVADPRFVTNAQRVANRERLDDVIVPMFAAAPAAHWIERLRAADILCGPINSLADVVADPSLAAGLPMVAGMAPGIPQAIGYPVRVDGAWRPTRSAAPAKGAHTHDVLSELGYTPAEIAVLLADGSAFGRRG